MKSDVYMLEIRYHNVIYTKNPNRPFDTNPSCTKLKIGFGPVGHCKTLVRLNIRFLNDMTFLYLLRISFLNFYLVSGDSLPIQLPCN